MCSQTRGQVAECHEGCEQQNMRLSSSKVSEQLLPKFRQKIRSRPKEKMIGAIPEVQYLLHILSFYILSRYFVSRFSHYLFASFVRQFKYYLVTSLVRYFRYYLFTSFVSQFWYYLFVCLLPILDTIFLCLLKVFQMLSFVSDFYILLCKKWNFIVSTMSTKCGRYLQVLPMCMCSSVVHYSFTAGLF